MLVSLFLVTVLVPVQPIVVTVLIARTIVTLVECLISQPRAVVSGGIPVRAIVAEVAIPIPVAIVAALLDAFVVAGVQRRLSQVIIAAVVLVTAPIAAVSIRIIVPVSIVVAVPIAVAIVVVVVVGIVAALRVKAVVESGLVSLTKIPLIQSTISKT